MSDNNQTDKQIEKEKENKKNEEEDEENHEDQQHQKDEDNFPLNTRNKTNYSFRPIKPKHITQRIILGEQ
jgi:hypothetical protein